MFSWSENAGPAAEYQRCSLWGTEKTQHWILLGRLASGLVHEINNPLDAVINCLHELKSGDLPEEKRTRYLALAEDELFRLSGLTKRLLGLARDSRRELAATDVNELVEKALFLVDYRLNVRRIAVEQKLARDLPVVTADPRGILQVLVNLFLNACDAMPDGGELCITTENRQGSLLLVVKDTGTGIAPDNLRKVFLPFFSTKQEEGVGLGLAICQNIVEQHGGEIEVESVPGKGTTFTVRLPLTQRAAGTTGKARRPGRTARGIDRAS